MSNKCDKLDNDCREEKLTCKGCAYDTTGTIIKAKYKIGQKVWIVDANLDHKQVDVYADIITAISLNGDENIYYFLKELYDEIIESKIIPYEDTETLLKEIIKADNEVNLKE